MIASNLETIQINTNKFMGSQKFINLIITAFLVNHTYYSVHHSFNLLHHQYYLMHHKN